MELISPKQVAKAIGVSESSLKRWCDDGRIEATRTAGGHRKLAISSVLEFIKSTGRELEEPEVLGLPAQTGLGTRSVSSAKKNLAKYLLDGNETACRQIISSLYLSNVAVSTVCDEVICGAFAEIGEKWICEEIEIYQERRACEISSLILHEIRLLLPPIKNNAPLALGGTIDDDPYTIATSMVELVLRDKGWNASSLGNFLPFRTLRSAIEVKQPKIFWVCVASIREMNSFIAEMNHLYETASKAKTALVVGGRALTEDVRKQIKYTCFCDTMQHLESFSESLIKKTE